MNTQTWEEREKKLFLEIWMLGEDNANNSHGGFGHWYERNKPSVLADYRQSLEAAIDEMKDELEDPDHDRY